MKNRQLKIFHFVLTFSPFSVPHTRIVIDRIKPTFVKSLPKIITTSGKSILMSLNGNQRDAILRALTANEYLLLKGLPGTGKTQTLCALIRLLVLMGKSILITSHTHSAVDNLLLRLRKCAEQIDFMRLGSTKRMHPDLRDRSEDSYTSNCTTPDELTSVYNRFVSVYPIQIFDKHEKSKFCFFFFGF